MSGVVSKKLKFKGEKTKKKKRSHRELDDNEAGPSGSNSSALVEQGEPTDWIFPSNVFDCIGPSFIILPSSPPTCLAWEPTRQRVYAAPLVLPVAPAGEDELSLNEVLEAVEPTDVNQVWVISRLSGSESVISLRTSTGTFLTAAPSGSLTASTPSRGPLEAFTPTLTTSSSLHPSFSLLTNSQSYISLSLPDIKPTTIGLGKQSLELRADVKELGEMESWKIKCQREFVVKATIEREEASGGGGGKRIKLGVDGRPIDKEGTLADEREQNLKYQAWGAGKSVVSESDRREIKRARKEGKLAEALLDRRAALKSDKFAK